ncbi:MAG: sulfate adenylyltransferase [Alcaligenaceae bacterium]|nr:sulfate adenylyltransferase [Alcaligenaceae bacterium]
MTSGLVRFITAGSVDDGKSTLIGRLLFDTKAVLADQVQSLSSARHTRVRANDADFDLALLTDGLEAEREQGITIDVAYRYFATARRKFIVADAPGHEQYTRNLVTGASQSDAAVILVDPTRLGVDADAASLELLAQTKRHTAIVRLLGLRHVVFAVNKMDLIGYEQGAFQRIRGAISMLAAKVGLRSFDVIPVSALSGDNVVHRSLSMPWYDGPTLLEWLEQRDDVRAPDTDPGLRLPVQYVARQDGQSADDFRGYLGQVEAGTLFKGQRVRVLPGGAETIVAGIYLSNGREAVSNARAAGTDDTSATLAVAGQAVVVELKDDIDVSRGDLIVAADATLGRQPQLARKISADICWLDKEPLNISRKYSLQHTTREVFARVAAIDHVLDIHTLDASVDTATLAINDIGRVDLVLQSPIAADRYEDLQATGAFVLIDDATKSTVAAGMIRSVVG